MRIMYWFNWNFTYLSHAMSIKLKERYGVEEFSGLVVGRNLYNFLVNQKDKDITYSNLKLAQDIYLKCKEEEIDENYLDHLEKKYGIPNLWPLLYSDRALTTYNEYYKYSRDEYLKIVQVFFREIEDLVSSVKPDYVIFDVVASFPAYVLYKVAQAYGAKTIIFKHTRVKNRITFSYDTYEGFNKIFNIFEDIKNGYDSKYKNDAINYLKEFGSKNVKPSYMEGVDTFADEKRKPSFLIKRASRLFHYLNQYYFGYYKEDYEFKNKGIMNASFEEITKYYRRRKIRGLKYYKPNPEDKYIFFPLHYEPEMTINVMAPYYMNQLCLIENIAKALPINYKLYVKEHPWMTVSGLRELSYYKKLQEIPGVFLVSSYLDSYDIIKNSRLVTTITGTVGWEALLLKKPVISFGRVFFNKLSGIRKCDNPEELPYMIKDAINNNVHNDTELINFLAAVFEGSFEAGFMDLQLSKEFDYVLKHKDFNVLVENLAQELGIND